MGISREKTAGSAAAVGLPLATNRCKYAESIDKPNGRILVLTASSAAHFEISGA